MEAMRATWTDERLDDLRDEVVRQGGRIDAMGARIDAMGGRIDKLTHAIVVVGGSLLAAFIAFTAALLGLIITRL
ncbi:MAG: hypothetical protein JST31_12200 [Actinobacteria bacterium]|nr:hypothetical protein [Actinomycetota bacterium]